MQLHSHFRVFNMPEGKTNSTDRILTIYTANFYFHNYGTLTTVELELF